MLLGIQLIAGLHSFVTITFREKKAMSSWRVYQGVGHLADIVAKAALLLELQATSQDEVVSGNAELHEAIALLHNGTAECRELLPHLEAYATQVFENPDPGIGESCAPERQAPTHQGAAPWSSKAIST
jgi:hypothetical protein